jgi:hypothetical protein
MAGIGAQTVFDRWEIESGSISKRGNTYLRMLLIQGARALMIHMKKRRRVWGNGFTSLKSGVTHTSHSLRWPTRSPASAGRFCPAMKFIVRFLGCLRLSDE